MNKKKNLIIKIFMFTSLFVLFTVNSVFASGWTKGISKNAWWYDLGNGNYHKSSWQWIDGNNDGIAECYCFDENGWMFENTITPDKYTVNENGAWTVNNIVQTKNANSLLENKNDNNGNNNNNIIVNNSTINSEINNENFSDKQDEYRADILRKINEYRENQGKSELLEDDELNDYAEIRAEEINTRKSHIRPNGKLSVDGRNIKGEIITDALTPKEAFLNWKKSKGHNELMLASDFENFGAGCYPSKNGKYWWVIIFH